MLGFSGQLQEKINSLKSEIDSLNVKYNEAYSICDFALWEYDISSKTMRLTKKLFGKFSDVNKDIPNYREQMLNWKLVHPEDLNIFIEYCDSMDNGDSKFSYEYRQITDNNLFRWLRSEGVTVFDNVGNAKIVIGRTLDVTAEKEKDEILIERANTDFLTKINTKDNTYSLIRNTLNDYPNTKCAFLLIDVDDFKYINDSFGHSFGDSVLVKLSTILTANINNSKDIVGRLGGDEFCVFLFDINDEADVRDYYNRVKEALCNVSLGEDNNAKISVGVVLFPDSAKDLSEMLSKADLALYQTKFNSKNSITFFDSSMKMPVLVDSSSRSRSLESLSAIENIEVNDFSNFDPVKVKDDLINSYEAFKNLNIAYYIITEDYKIRYCSPNLKDVFPECEKVILGTNCYETIRKQYAPCFDCPLRNGHNCNIHFASNYEDSQMDYNVTYHRFNNSNGILVCWNDLTDFTKTSAFTTDYLSKMMIYSTFIIETNRKIKEREISYKMVYFSIDDFRNLSKDTSLNNAIDLFVDFASILKSEIREYELVTITTPYEFYALIENTDDFDKRIRNISSVAERLLTDKFGLNVKIITGVESIKANDNNAHIIAMNAKNNSGGNL